MCTREEAEWCAEDKGRRDREVERQQGVEAKEEEEDRQSQVQLAMTHENPVAEGEVQLEMRHESRGVVEAREIRVQSARKRQILRKKLV